MDSEVPDGGEVGIRREIAMNDTDIEQVPDEELPELALMVDIPSR
ncbi:hypothetical protein [Streptomyces sp. XH2]